MPFFHYSQNNSGGKFDIDEDRGISVNVIVEAANSEEADCRAEEIGLYFNGADEGKDCSCCGDRWYTVYGEGSEAPAYYGELIDFNAPMPRESRFLIKWAGDKPEGYVHYLDGTVKEFWRS